jgi:hypothetical protein
MKIHNFVLASTFFFAFLSGICAKSQERNILTAETLTDALEKGYSLVIADVLSFDKSGKEISNVKIKIISPIILGDLTEYDCNSPVELSAGEKDLHDKNIEIGSRYALFIIKNCPYEFSLIDTNDLQHINKSDTNQVKELTRLAESAYAKTAIFSFRKELLSNDKVNLSSVPDEIISMCEKFKTDSENRSITAQKIYSSDIGTDADSAPKTALSRNQISSLLGSSTIKSGWTYSWLCGQPVERGWVGRDVFVLSVIFDRNQTVQKMIYGQDKKGKWTKIERALNALYGLPGHPESVLVRFQKSIQEQNWQAVLSLCSENIQKIVQGNKSIEEFLKTYLPIDDLLKMAEFPTTGYIGSSNKISNINLELSISSSKTDNDAPVSWKWSLVRDKDIWLVDFKVLPVDILIKKERLISKFINAEPNVRAANTAKFSQGIKYNLVPVSEKYAIGQPMLFKVEMINISEEPISFSTSSSTSIMTNNPMYITGPQKEEIDYVDTSYQISVGTDIILPKEIIILVDSYDVTSQYFIKKPGKYYFQFRGWPERENNITSNTVELEVKQGELSAQDSIYERIIKILPEGWKATRRLVDLGLSIEKESDKPVFVSLIGERKSKQIDVGIILVISKNNNLLSSPIVSQSQLWGRCKWGYVYGTGQNADTIWPDYRSQLIKALEVKENQPSSTK